MENKYSNLTKEELIAKQKLIQKQIDDVTACRKRHLAEKNSVQAEELHDVLDDLKSDSSQINTLIAEFVVKENEKKST